MDSPKTDEKGNMVLTLPVSTLTVKIRPPKGRDLIELERLSQAEDATNLSIAFRLASVLSGIPYEDLLEFDAEDAMGVVNTVTSFRALGTLARN